ncbi:MAG: hypothetical protein JHC33_13545 [Ignisphaera sp.]|jgi:hypothetical protein|nr:hypothetical protein [Ignisphaera sp.]
MKIEQLLNEEGTTSGAVAGGSYTSVVSTPVMKRIKGQFASYGLGEKSCPGCDLINTSYETMGSRKSPKLVTCPQCGTQHKIK